MHVRDVLITGQCVADQHRIAAFGIERAVGLIGDLKRRKFDTGIEPQRPVHAKMDNIRMRIVRLARTIGAIKCDTDIDHRKVRSSAPRSMLPKPARRERL